MESKLAKSQVILLSHARASSRQEISLPPRVAMAGAFVLDTGEILTVGAGDTVFLKRGGFRIFFPWDTAKSDIATMQACRRV